LGWTMRDLWRRSKVSIDAISRLERGKGSLQAWTLGDLRATFAAAGVTFARNAAPDGKRKAVQVKANKFRTKTDRNHVQ
jgi:hypothetical protein